MADSPHALLVIARRRAKLALGAGALVLSTQCSSDRLKQLHELCLAWDGVVSCAILLEDCSTGAANAGPGAPRDALREANALARRHANLEAVLLRRRRPRCIPCWRRRARLGCRSGLTADGAP